MKLALVSPLPPLPCRAAEVVLKLIPRLARADDVELHLFAHAPEQVAPGFSRHFPLHPTADLPHLLRSGEIDLPVYVFDVSDYHFHQLRLMSRHAGIVATLATKAEVGGWLPDQYKEVLHHCEAYLQASQVDMILEVARERAQVGHRTIPDDRHWPTVETVTVAYNSRRIIGSCLRALLAQDYDNLKITVVDNASADGTADYIRNEFPRVNLIASPTNLGFAGGNNLAFARADAKYVVLMNQDAIPRRDCIRELVQAARSAPRCSCAGAPRSSTPPASASTRAASRWTGRSATRTRTPRRGLSRSSASAAAPS
jgi:hypothetical protein